jgi:hypothetical protein
MQLRTLRQVVPALCLFPDFVYCAAQIGDGSETILAPSCSRNVRLVAKAQFAALCVALEI